MSLFNGRVIDLTHLVDSGAPTWNGTIGYRVATLLDYADCSAESGPFCVQSMKMYAGVGTHIDMPAHCIPGGLMVDELELAQMVVGCSVVDVSEQAHEAYVVSPVDIAVYEQQYGRIPQGNFVIIHTGWGRYWPSSDLYRNDFKFPTISVDTAKMLVDRKIVGVGIDTLSPDGANGGFPVHRMLLGAGIYIVENVANAERMPPVNSWVVVAPMKIGGTTEAPVRLLGFVSKD